MNGASQVGGHEMSDALESAHFALCSVTSPPTPSHHVAVGLCRTSPLCPSTRWASWEDLGAILCFLACGCRRATMCRGLALGRLPSGWSGAWSLAAATRLAKLWENKPGFYIRAWPSSTTSSLPLSFQRAVAIPCRMCHPPVSMPRQLIPSLCLVLSFASCAGGQLCTYAPSIPLPTMAWTCRVCPGGQVPPRHGATRPPAPAWPS